jgi:hypothetical protein
VPTACDVHAVQLVTVWQTPAVAQLQAVRWWPNHRSMFEASTREWRGCAGHGEDDDGSSCTCVNGEVAEARLVDDVPVTESGEVEPWWLSEIARTLWQSGVDKEKARALWSQLLLVMRS